MSAGDAPGDVTRVAALRQKLWEAEFRPLAVWNVEDDRARGKTEQLGKHPFGPAWPNMARQNPPVDAAATPDRRALNTGILADGLRVVDLDIDDIAISNDCLQIAWQMWPGAPCRYRDNSARKLVLLRAAEGTPRKVVLAGAAGKIEVLGAGQQFVAFGVHESGAELQWTEAPGDVTLADLPVTTEEEIQTFLARCAPIISADKPTQRTNGEDHKSAQPQAGTQRVALALAAVPNTRAPDWEWWNTIGMACWRATGGAEAGFALFDDWSRRNPAYDSAETRARWDHYRTSPPSKIGAGTIFHLAAEHGWREPRPEDDPNYAASLEAQARQEARPSARDATPAELAACSHVWRSRGQHSEGKHFPCTPTGTEDTYNGSAFVQVKLWDGSLHFAPKDEVIPNDQIDAVEAAEAAAKRAANAGQTHTLSQGQKDSVDEPEPPPDWDERHPPADETPSEGVHTPRSAWPDPIDCFTPLNTSAVEVTADEAPPALWPFISDTAARMGVATSTVTLCTIVTCSAVISDEWRLQPKRHDYLWTENARLWGAIVGPPSILKTPVIAACTHPIDQLEREAREQWQADMRQWRERENEAKEKGTVHTDPKPKRARRLVESTTVEALQEVLRDDEDARFTAPAKKVLVRQDELSEFLANLDRYSAGRPGGDRAAYLRLYNGGSFTVDRIGRGSFTASNWSGCLLGGIQPEPIQRIAKQTVDDGLLQRMTYDVPQQPPDGGTDRKPDRKALDRYHRLIPALAALAPASSPQDQRPHAIVLHADAQAHRESIDQVARNMVALPDISPRLQSVFGKWPGLFARLCLTFHLIEVADARAGGNIGRPINEVSAETAERVGRYMRRVLLRHLLRAEALMFATVQTGHVKWVAGHILANKLDRITVRDVYRAYNALSAPEDREELHSVMANLASLGWLDPERPRNPLNPVSAWRVNPAVHAIFAGHADQERKERRERQEETIARRQAHAEAHTLNANSAQNC